MASVELKHMAMQFGKTPVIRDFSLEVRDGEFLVLVGPSGCGKSTCLRIMAGLESPTAGDVLIDGVSVLDVPPKDRDVGMVFQSYALYPHMTVFDNLAFPLRMRRLRRHVIQDRVHEIAEMLDLEEYLKRRPGQLSGGQRQRVAMGRALVRKPRVFLFDEPLSNLDAALRVRMRAELAALHRRLGTTMIYVTHDQVEAMTLGSRIAVLNAGELQQVATPLELYNRPANRFVAGFVGSPAMNFIQGSVVFDPERSGLLLRLLSGERLELGGMDSSSFSPQTEITIGIRPQDVEVGRQLVLGGFPAEVEAIEPMGPESTLYVRGLGVPLIAMIRGEGVLSTRVGETVYLSLDPRKIYVFDREGRCVGTPADGRVELCRVA